MADVPRPRTVPFGLAQQATGPGIYLQQAGGSLGFYTSVLFMNSALTFDAAGNAIVTPASLSPIGDQTILSNISGASAIPVGNTLSALLDNILGSTQGQIITRNSGTWTVLSPGALGTVLTSGGPGANVSYAAPSGGLAIDIDGNGARIAALEAIVASLANQINDLKQGYQL